MNSTLRRKARLLCRTSFSRLIETAFIDFRRRYRSGAPKRIRLVLSLISLTSWTCVIWRLVMAAGVNHPVIRRCCSACCSTAMPQGYFPAASRSKPRMTRWRFVTSRRISIRTLIPSPTSAGVGREPTPPEEEPRDRGRWRRPSSALKIMGLNWAGLREYWPMRGYYSADKVDECEQAKMTPCISAHRETHNVPLGEPEQRYSRRPEEADAVTKMAHRMNSAEGRSIYSKCKSTVERVFGVIKQMMGCRRCHLRGFNAARGE